LPIYLVDRTYRTDHHRIRVQNTELVPAVERAITAMAEPMGSHDGVAFHLLSEQVSPHVKVAQSGQGADEVLAGYGYHQPFANASRTGVVDLFTENFFDRSHAEMAQVVQPEYLCDHDATRRLAEHHLLAPGAETALDAAPRLDTHLLLPDDPVKRAGSRGCGRCCCCRQRGPRIGWEPVARAPLWAPSRPAS
jgi:asparagine synthase (glutamine-hydrolysing)